MNTPQHSFHNIVQLFNTAKQKLQRAKMQIDVDGVQFTISAAPATGKNPGCLYVKRGEDYLGKIYPNASYQGNLNHIEALRKLDENPVDRAIMHGKQTGYCCFCGIALTDPRSVAMGYGPICAGNWGLPWGDEKAAAMQVDVTDLVQMAEDAAEQRPHDKLATATQSAYDYALLHDGAFRLCEKGEQDWHNRKVPMTVEQMASCIVHDIAAYYNCGIVHDPRFMRDGFEMHIIELLRNHQLINL